MNLVNEMLEETKEKYELKTGKQEGGSKDEQLTKCEQRAGAKTIEASTVLA